MADNNDSNRHTSKMSWWSYSKIGVIMQFTEFVQYDDDRKLVEHCNETGYFDCTGSDAQVEIVYELK